MKKYRLEDIKKRQVFTSPPEGYFEKLPRIIQEQTTYKGRKGAPAYWITALKLVPAAALVVLIALYTGLIGTSDNTMDLDGMLAEVTSEDIILYLEELDISNEEILSEVDLTALSLGMQEMEDPLMETLDIDDEALIEWYDDLEGEESLL